MQTSKAAFLWEKGKSTTKKKDILKFYEVIFKNKCQIIWYKSQTPSFLRSGYIILAWSDNAAKGSTELLFPKHDPGVNTNLPGFFYGPFLIKISPVGISG